MKFHNEPDSAFTLHDKVAVITGAESGLGQEAARIFALSGAPLVLADIDALRFGPPFCRVLVEA
jgi:NAD(P)-dependent dehydrogenase (short-subunit alcohol dehydrogenase family)